MHEKEKRFWTIMRNVTSFLMCIVENLEEEQ